MAKLKRWMIFHMTAHQPVNKILTPPSCSTGTQIAAGTLLAANWKTASFSSFHCCSLFLSLARSFCLLLCCFPTILHLSPHSWFFFFSLCLFLGILFTMFDLGIPFPLSRQNNLGPNWTASPNVHTHIHRRTHTHTLFLITHRKWAPVQTRSAWPLEPRMAFEDLKCSLVEETEPEFSLYFFGSALFHLF